ncbi:MAG: asparagine synthase (glutamine-hydrolyzing) [Verrucomicrobiaceae bacterium]|nr:asparagine synthase (glutamine-hydrolyzing) [Verrucomicrobiaceae bacterium]
MCGIAGIIDAASTRSSAPARALVSLLAALRHRGPDDEGWWAGDDGMAALVHTRLSILDPRPAGHQPMRSADGRHVITFNGEIYNFRELRTALESDGGVFQTQTDTEVLLQLYARHGADMLGMLRGMFALGIWDEARRECFLARDAFGIKPLYYSVSGGVFVFASEVKALQEAGLAGGRLNARALAGYLECGAVPEPDTLVDGVSCLEAGHWLAWKDGVLTKRCWWRPRFPVEAARSPATGRNDAADLRDALIDSVRHHHVSDVPVGVFLSGGMDSTALVALSRLAGFEHFKTFSVGLADAHIDESAIAGRTAAHFGTDHHEMQLDDARARTLFAEFLNATDQPTIDGFNTFVVSTLAGEHGMKVVLSGLGGDEMFAGYASFTRLPRLLALSAAARVCGPLRHLAGHGLWLLGTHGGLRRLGEYLHGPLTLGSAYRAFRGVFTQRDARRLAAHYAGCAESGLAMSSDPVGEGPTQADEISSLELRHYLRNQLLKDNDVMTMARGLELRVPFIDRVLFEKVAPMPAEVRLRPGKRLLLEAVPEIPEWVRSRPKSGFHLPFLRWMHGGLADYFSPHARSAPVRVDHWQQRMSLLVLGHWLRRHGLESP